ncbi:hypothetical protein EJB05_31433, partial [Eragrostis curvula]
MSWEQNYLHKAAAGGSDAVKGREEILRNTAGGGSGLRLGKPTPDWWSQDGLHQRDYNQAGADLLLAPS